jgi:AMP deaminase
MPSPFIEEEKEAVNNTKDIPIIAAEFPAPTAPAILNPESMHVIEALEKCLALRDKYIKRSLQRLGDNPRDYDGQFTGLDDEHATAPGVRPDVDIKTNSPPSSVPEKWNIYPPPPPPFWHYHGQSQSDEKPLDEDFDFSKCDIPGEHTFEFEIDDKGVYQVYERVEGTMHLLFRPSYSV